MKKQQLFIFIGGMATGALLLYLTLYIISVRTESSEKEKLRQQLIQTISNKITDLNEETEIQYIEVKGKKGIVTLHTGMSKDSVKVLLGKPDEVNLMTVMNSTHESWGYKLKNEYVSDLDIEFVDGKLDGVRQN
jgi:ethanolamine utilization protein EutQ (cupin superfamily)